MKNIIKFSYTAGLIITTVIFSFVVINHVALEAEAQTTGTKQIVISRPNGGETYTMNTSNSKNGYYIDNISFTSAGNPALLTNGSTASFFTASLISENGTIITAKKLNVLQCANLNTATMSPLSSCAISGDGSFHRLVLIPTFPGGRYKLKWSVGGLLDDTSDNYFTIVNPNGKPLPSTTITPTTSGVFAIGDRVRLAVDFGGIYSTAENLVNHVGAIGGRNNIHGTIVSGPVSGGGNVLWNVDFDSGADGWTWESFLVKSSGTIGSGGGATTPIPVVTLSSSADSLIPGQSSTLTWSSTNNPTSCTASGGWSGTKASSGSATVSPTTNTTYYLTCNNSAGSSALVSASITVGGNTTTTGNVKIKRVGSDYLTLGVTTQAKVSATDTGTFISANPADFTGVTSSSALRAYTTDLSGYTVSVAQCTYTTSECSMSTENLYSSTNVTCSAGYCSVPVSIANGRTTKVVFRYVAGQSTGSGLTVLPWSGPSTVVSNSSDNAYTLNWDGSLPSDFKKDWEVFIHFVKTDNPSVVFGTGFWPSPGSSNWSGRVSSSNRFAVPVGQAPGIYDVMVGLYNGSTRVSVLKPGPGVEQDRSQYYRYKVGTITVTSSQSGSGSSSGTSNTSSSNTGQSTSQTPTNITVLPWSGPSTVVADGSGNSYTLNWDGVLPDGYKRNWQVFIHMINRSDPSKVISIGFWPTPSTSNWSGRVSTSDMFSIPAGQSPGTYDVMVGLYDGGTRVPLTPGALGGDSQRRYKVGTIEIRSSDGNTGSIWDALRQLLNINL